MSSPILIITSLNFSNAQLKFREIIVICWGYRFMGFLQTLMCNHLWAAKNCFDFREGIEWFEARAARVFDPQKFLQKTILECEITMLPFDMGKGVVENGERSCFYLPSILFIGKSNAQK